MLAEIATATPDPKFFWELMLSLGFMLSIAVQFVTIATLRQRQKREITYGFVPASKEEFEKHVALNQREHENLFSKVGGVERGQASRMEILAKEWRTALTEQTDEIKSSATVGREKLHERITDLLGEFKELRGEINEMKRK